MTNDADFAECDVFENESSINLDIEHIGSGDSDFAQLQKKHGLIFIDSKRYYFFDMTSQYYSLDNTSPFIFSCPHFEIKETSWNRMVLKVLQKLDELSPKPSTEYLDIKYWWNSKKAFSLTPKRYFLPFKFLYLNAGLSSTHCMRAIQQFLELFHVPLSDCCFILRRYYVSEHRSIREYIRKETIKDFSSCLNFQGYSQKRIESTISNVEKMNGLLKKINTSYDDFFLFDDYYCFLSQKAKAISKAEEIYHDEMENNLVIVKNVLSRLDIFYRNRDFYNSVSKREDNYILRNQLKEEIVALFKTLKTPVITAEKLYARMKMFHNDILESLGEFNTPYHLFLFAAAFLRKEYVFQYPFISNDKEIILDNNDIVLSFAYEQSEFTVSDLNEYIDKMHLKRIDNYFAFMNSVSKDYVLVSCDRMIRKDCFKAEKELLDKLQKELKYYINSFGPINSTTYNGYSSLPEFEENWNKYLLLGFVRTFFSNTFKIAYKGNKYTTIEFVIDLL